MTVAFLASCFCQFVQANDGTVQVKDYITYNNKPMGSLDKPFVLRTFVPNLDLEDEVTARHSRASTSPIYSPRSGKWNNKKTYKMISGLPATISVNLGPNLSYVWDTTECRLIYAWSGGFLNMDNYWGARKSGGRKGFGYVPTLVGHLFYKAVGKHPLKVNGKNLETYKYHGNKRIAGNPIYQFKSDGRLISLKILPGKNKQTVELLYQSSNSKDTLGYDDAKTPFEVLDNQPGNLKVLLRPNTSQLFKTEKKKIRRATKEIGEELYTTLGCMACHTIDGAKNHGPTFKGVLGKSREFEKHPAQIVDESYLKESILKPSEKTVKGFQAGMMPVYQLDEKQLESIVLFIKSLK